MAAENRLAQGRPPVPVLYVLDELRNAGAGTETQFLRLLRNLDRGRFTPSVALLRGDDRYFAGLADVHVDVLGIRSLRTMNFLSEALQLARRMRSGRVGIAHVYLNDAAIALPSFLRLGGAKVIVSRRDLGFWYTPSNLRLLRAQRFAVSAVIANCDAVKQSVVQHEGYSPDRIAVIENGFEQRSELLGRSEARRRLGIEIQRPVVTIVANLRPLKRIADAIQAIAAVREEFPQILLQLVGEDPPHRGSQSHGQEMRQLAASLGIAGHVSFVGSQSDPMPYIEAADACMLCSETEGLSNSVIEYLWAGKAVIATDVGGNPELISQGRTGFLVPVGDVRQMADRLRVVLGSEGPVMGQRAREHAVSNFSTHVMAQRHADLYERVLNGGGEGAGVAVRTS
ncbi:MAG TPA: glycosyltransferase [Povalibacter sp.]|uniref:glycosyltransferase n=1 Tax=Povalibacter sp. TaxID=1962978 RepID=UPI002C2FCF7B|nr:glycosyltransferase [Povalibacter sp.]HMN42964.1 glycosyltransferase [Povalibacter sp.]